MSEPGALPTFLIVGAAKCGTTSLHRYLDLHPEIGMSARKEPKVFSREDWREHLGWYRRQFSPEFDVRGESSPTYAMHPAFPGVPARIHALIPAAKLIYLVRDPVDRLVAHYVEERTLRFERRSLDEVIADFDAPDNRCVVGSRYAHQLAQFREYFPSEQILVIDQWDLLNDRPEVLRTVFEFLEVDPTFWAPDFERLHNQRDSKSGLNRLGWWLHERGVLGPGARRARHLPAGARRRMKSLVAEKIPTPVLDDAARHTLEERFSAEVARLRSETGKAFSRWRI